MEQDDFDLMLRHSPVFAQAVTDAIGGAVTLVSALIELLVGKEALTEAEIIEYLRREARALEQSELSWADRRAIETALGDAEQFAASGLPRALRALYRARRGRP